MIPTMSFESMWAPVMEWMGLSVADLDDVLPNWQNTGSPLVTKADLYDNTTNSAAFEEVKYGARNFIRLKDQLKWLEDSFGEATYTSIDPSTDEFGHLWFVRSEEGDGTHTAVDP